MNLAENQSLEKDLQKVSKGSMMDNWQKDNDVPKTEHLYRKFGQVKGN